MKKAVLTLAGLFAVLTAFADTVGRQQAQTIAQRWLGTEVTEAAYGSDAFYIFNGTEGGWVIVSAEDASTPILGYSDKGSLDPGRVSSNFRHWVKGYEEGIRDARIANKKATTEVKALWKTAGYRTKASSQIILDTPEWGQDSPYNDLCPQVVEGGKTHRAVTGCVATAMAEVIRYWEWPEHGTGTIGGYTYRSDYSVNVTINSYSIDSHFYDYSLMPFKYNGAETSAQKNAVAQLMHDCGVMVEAMYNYGTGTGAYSENIANALITYMSYAPTARLIYRLAYTDAEWTKILEKEIDNGRPVLYGANDPKAGGHQFVCDGYDTKDYVHINWGWNASGNGFFTLTLNIPGSYTFSDDQDIVIGIEPNKTGQTGAYAGPLMIDAAASDSPGLVLKSGNVLDKSFTISADAISNVNYYVDYSGAVKAGLLDWKGDLKEYISDELPLDLGGYSIVRLNNIKCTITGDVVFGDRVVLFYKTDGGEWEIIKGHQAYDNSGRTVYLSSSIPAVDAAYILVPASPKAGDTFFFELVPGSNPVKTVSWYYDSLKQPGITANLTSGTHTVKAEVTFKDGSKETLTAKILVK